MKITIVVPVYNVEQYIGDCLASITAQTYTGGIECLLIDDCTPDGSCAIIENFIKEYNGAITFKLLHHTRNRGLSAARNTGIDAATGDYIYFLDSDDELMPNTIALLSTALKENSYDLVIGNYQIIGTDKEYPPLLLDTGEIKTNKNIRELYFGYQWYVMAWNKLCNLNFIRKHQLYFKESLLNEDNLWSFQLACEAQSMYVVNENTYKYKVRESSIMGKMNPAKTANAFATITNEAYKWAEEKGYIYDKKVFNSIIYYREYALGIIFLAEPRSKSVELYMQCYKRLRIAAWWAYKNRLIGARSLIKELYNYLPKQLGYWYLSAYNHILKR